MQLVCVGRGKLFIYMSDGAPFEKAICKSSIENGCISYLYAIIYFQETEFTNKGKRGKRI